MPASGRSSIELSIDQKSIQVVTKALRAEADGKALRKELVADLRTAIAPGISEVQAKLRAIPHESGTRSSPPLGSYLASKVKPQVRMSGRATGVAVRIARTPQLRGFTFAAKRFNRDGWRHKVFGREVWVEQTSPIRGYFDQTLGNGKAKYRAAVIQALEAMARRIAERR
jgi:hypothetical protein